MPQTDPPAVVTVCPRCRQLQHDGAPCPHEPSSPAPSWTEIVCLLIALGLLGAAVLWVMSFIIGRIGA